MRMPRHIVSITPRVDLARHIGAIRQLIPEHGKVALRQTDVFACDGIVVFLEAADGPGDDEGEGDADDQKRDGGPEKVYCFLCGVSDGSLRAGRG